MKMSLLHLKYDVVHTIFKEHMPTWGCILENFLSNLLPVNFFSFLLPFRYHGLNSVQTPTGEWESGSLAAGSEEEHLAMQMAELSQLSRLCGAGSDLSEFLHALGQLVTNPK